MELWGVRFIGVNPHTGEKFLLTLAVIAVYIVLRALLRALTGVLSGSFGETRFRFWARQAVNVVTTAVLILGLLSIWFDDPRNLATALGLVTAGLAFALQRVVTAVAGYLVILRGKTFNVGDRIMMGGVRGDVIALDFIQTTIMEMGQPPPVQSDEPAMWVYGRQFTGRIVTVSNAQIFDEPIYNYSREFPLIWEEMRLPVPFGADRARAERILLDAAERHTRELIRGGEAEVQRLMRRYAMPDPDLEPRVFFRITDNWLEMALRFVSPAHGARALKDAMSRDILRDLDAAGIGVASGTYDVVGLPPIRIAAWPSPPDAPSR